MAFIRKKKVKGYSYYYAVEGVYSSNGKLKQKVIRYLGSVENILEKFKFWDEKSK